MNKLLTFGVFSTVLISPMQAIGLEVSDTSTASVAQQGVADSKSSQPAEEASNCNSKEGFVSPRLIYSADPEITERDAKRRYMGKYQFSLTVDEEGMPANVRLIQSPPVGKSSKERKTAVSMEANAVKAVTQYRFAPGTYQGKPVRCKTSVEIDFRIY